MQDGDVISTHADTAKLQNWIKYSPQTSIEEGVKKFANWYLHYFD
jgi:UDP-glucuronate 4-epimerase